MTSTANKQVFSSICLHVRLTDKMQHPYLNNKSTTRVVTNFYVQKDKLVLATTKLTNNYKLIIITKLQIIAITTEISLNYNILE